MNTIKSENAAQDPSTMDDALLTEQEKRLIKELKKTGCPVCNHMEDTLFGFFATFQYTLANNEKAQREHAAELGFCPAHTWQLAQTSSSSGLSRGYQTLLLHFAEKLTQLNGDSSDIANGIAQLIIDAENCRACRVLQEAEHSCMRQLAVFLEQEKGRVAYSASQGVCLRHLRLLVSFQSHREVVEFLLFEAVRHLKETAEYMQRFVLKIEALERHLISRDERYSYRHGLVYVAGGRNVYALHLMRI